MHPTSCSAAVRHVPDRAFSPGNSCQKTNSSSMSRIGLADSIGIEIFRRYPLVLRAKTVTKEMSRRMATLVTGRRWGSQRRDFLRPPSAAALFPAGSSRRNLSEPSMSAAVDRMLDESLLESEPLSAIRALARRRRIIWPSRTGRHDARHRLRRWSTLRPDRPSARPRRTRLHVLHPLHWPEVVGPGCESAGRSRLLLGDAGAADPNRRERVEGDGRRVGRLLRVPAEGASSQCPDLAAEPGDSRSRLPRGPAP